MLVSLWEIIFIFVFKKVLFSVWLLVLLLQILVYMATWQVKYPPTARILLFELKRIVLGEFMDDIEFASRISETFGIQDNSSKTALD